MSLLKHENAIRVPKPPRWAEIPIVWFVLQFVLKLKEKSELGVQIKNQLKVIFRNYEKSNQLVDIIDLNKLQIGMDFPDPWSVAFPWGKIVLSGKIVNYILDYHIGAQMKDGKGGVIDDCVVNFTNALWDISTLVHEARHLIQQKRVVEIMRSEHNLHEVLSLSLWVFQYFFNKDFMVRIEKEAFLAQIDFYIENWNKRPSILANEIESDVQYYYYSRNFIPETGKPVIFREYILLDHINAFLHFSNLSKAEILGYYAEVKEYINAKTKGNYLIVGENGVRSLD